MSIQTQTQNLSVAQKQLTNLSKAQLEVLAAAQLAKTPLAKVSLWTNNNRRADKNDAQFTGKLQISTVRMAEILAAALAAGQTEVDCWLDVWQNAPSVGKSGGDRPILSGRARSLVEPRAAAGDAQSDSILAALSAAAGK